MKKVIAIALATLAIGTSLASCGKYECEICGTTVEGKSYKIEHEGKKAKVCEDCKDLYEALSDLAAEFN